MGAASSAASVPPRSHKKKKAAAAADDSDGTARPRSKPPYARPARGGQGGKALKKREMSEWDREMMAATSNARKEIDEEQNSRLRA